MELPIVGPAYKHRSLPLSAQTCCNWFPEINQGAKRAVSLQPLMGAKAFSAGQSNAADRGMVVYAGGLYKVTGSSLFGIGGTGAQSFIGAILGTSRCEFATDGTTLIIVSDGNVYSYDGATLTLESDVDFESPTSVTYLNQQAIYNSDTQRFCVSDAGQLASISADNYATAEAAGDDLIRAYVFNHHLFLFGADTVESWWNSGSGNPPFDRLEGGIMESGLAAKASVAHTSKAMYFLGSDRQVYAVSGAVFSPISDPAIAHAMEGYDTVSDAIGFTFTFQGHRFYQLTFPTENKTWAYVEDAQAWIEVSSGTDGGAHLATSYAFWNGKHYVAENGHVHQWDADTFTDNGAVIRRERTTGVIDGAVFGAGDRAIEMSKLEVLLESGVGLTSGQGSDPQIMMQFSDDGGRTWSSELWRSAGQIGAYRWRARWDQLGQFRSRIFRFAVTDPVKWVIYGADADVGVGIG